MNQRFALVLLAFVCVLRPSAAPAQVSVWQLGGGGGLQWAAIDTNRILVDFSTVPTAIQPVYFTPERTVYSHLDNWAALRIPRELGFVDGERPRSWRDANGGEAPDRNGTYLVYGDSLTFTPPLSDPRVQIYFTIDTAVPVPAFRFGFYTPPRGFRSDGKPYAEDAIPAYEVSIAPEFDPIIYNGGYQRIGPLIARVPENLETKVQIDFPRQYVRFVRYQRVLSSIDNPVLFAVNSQAGTAQQGTIGDFELFAQGVPQRALYTTKIIDLGEELNFGRLHWSATPMRMRNGEPEPDPLAKAHVSIEVRSGRDDDPNLYHEYDDKGREVVVTRQRFEKELAPANRQRPGVRASVQYDAENWTFWSSPFTTSGQLLSLRSGSHMQLKIALQSTDFDSWIRLDSLWIERAPLLASQVLGEIASIDALEPRRGFSEVELGARTQFVYAIRPEFVSDTELGFDALRIRTGTRPTFERLQLDGQDAEPLSVEIEDDALVLHFPQRITAGQITAAQIYFSTEVFDFARTFSGEVFTDETPTLPQPVREGDADSSIGTSSLRVFGAVQKNVEFIQNLALSSETITPNGDGINDLLRVNYSLFRLPQAVPVVLNVYRLDGRRVIHRQGAPQPSGPQSIAWDGRDASGRVLAPGLYLLEIAVESESGSSRQVRPLGIAY